MVFSVRNMRRAVEVKVVLTSKASWYFEIDKVNLWLKHLTKWCDQVAKLRWVFDYESNEPKAIHAMA